MCMNMSFIHWNMMTTKRKKAKNGELAGYLPDVDSILQEKKGICFDYAALMATMLQSQNIPENGNWLCEHGRRSCISCMDQCLYQRYWMD